MFSPEETIDDPCDVTFVAEDGKELKAHRSVLASASPFFERMLNIGMRESREGIVRLQMVRESVLRDILEFIYTGCVQISAEDNAVELTAMADYLLLPHLKALAVKCLEQNLSVFNCISSYYCAEQTRCEGLFLASRSFILAHFTSVVKTAEFVNVSGEDLQVWISSDDLEVSTEDDVFKAILYWIGGDKLERRKYFAQLFRQVRLPYLSRDYLLFDVVTNELVKADEFCLNLVTKTRETVVSKINHPLDFKPRKSHATPVVVCFAQERSQEGRIQKIKKEGAEAISARAHTSPPDEQYHLKVGWLQKHFCKNTGRKVGATAPLIPPKSAPGKKEGEILCYFPREELWRRLHYCVPSQSSGFMFSCYSSLYFICHNMDSTLLRYDSLTNSWESLPFTEKRLSVLQVFVRNDDVFALVSEDCTCAERRLSFITKYNAKVNSWEHVCSVDLQERIGFCLVASDSFVYLLGGGVKTQPCTIPTYNLSAERYDLKRKSWEKMADLKFGIWRPQGVAANGKIFVVGGIREGLPPNLSLHVGKRYFGCAMYDETTDKWQFTRDLHFAGGKFVPHPHDRIMCFDEQLFVLGVHESRNHTVEGQIESYDPESNAWYKKTDIPQRLFAMDVLMSCTMTVFTGSKFITDGTSLL